MMMSQLKKTSLLTSLSLAFIALIYLLFNFEFRTPIISGFLFAVLTFPIYKWLAKQLNKLPRLSKFNFGPLAATITVLGTGILLFLILTIIYTQLADEIPRLFNFTTQAIRELPQNKDIVNLLNSWGLSSEAIQNLLSGLQKQVQNGVSSILSVDNINIAFDYTQKALAILLNQIVYIIIFLLSWFNGLLFGSSWINAILKLTPFEKEEVDSIKRDLTLGIRNVVYANLVAGGLNAIVVATLMTILGLPNVFLVGSLVFMIGFLPVTPSELGYAIPTLMILFGGNPLLAVIIMVLAELFILWQNYIFLPSLVLSDTKGNPLFIITSVLTGIAFFGVMGFIIGPVIMIFINTLSSIIQNRLEQADKVV
jgi:predicted PurR-regulated permease PerM